MGKAVYEVPFALRKVDQENNNRMNEDRLDNDPVPLLIEKIFHFKRLIERQGFLDGGSIGNIC